ncbi:MAG: nuclear transport factor 2 family protein [Actinomycetota bacterium]
MPPALVHYWTMWNEPDPTRIRHHLDRAVAERVVWVDPRDTFVGRDALEANVVALRTNRPGYRFVIASAVDGHHDRLRYRWDMMRGRRVLLRGLDIVTIDRNGLVARVDGFFGDPPPIDGHGHGIPAALLGE